MSNILKKATKAVTRSVKKIFDNPLQIGMYAAAAALMATGYGAGAGATLWAAAAGAGAGAASVGAFGKGAQDVASFGASVQQRYMEKMTGIQNAAAREQAKIAEEQNRQGLLQQIRATRIARAMSLADYAGEEGVTSSGALGNLGSIGSQYLSGMTSAVTIGRAQNAYQSYMNLYNQYQAKAQSSQIKWNNRLNLMNFALSVYGQGQGIQTGRLGNYYASLKASDAWSDVETVQNTAVGTTPSTAYRGYYYNYGV